MFLSTLIAINVCDYLEKKKKALKEKLNIRIVGLPKYEADIIHVSANSFGYTIEGMTSKHLEGILTMIEDAKLPERRQFSFLKGNIEDVLKILKQRETSK